MIKNTLLFTFILVFITSFAQPKITSFSPISGPVGTIVSIYGSGLSGTAANNIVYFGAVKASIVNVGSGWVNVLVPKGTTYNPITITVNGLTGYSAKPFIQTFPNGGTTFTSSSLMPTSQVITGAINSGAIGDFDNDGKTDVIGYNQSGVFSINRNTSTIGSVSFASPVNFNGGNYASRLISGDIDGDGKLDLISTNSGTTTTPASSLYVFRNTSPSVGSISFAPFMEFYTALQPIDVKLADLDGDGKTEIITINTYSNYSFYITILKNTSTIGNISFAQRIDINFGENPDKFNVADIDNDGKPEILVNGNSGALYIYKNTSTINSISFANRVNFPYGYGSFVVGDIDLDSKADICITTDGTTQGGAKIMLFRNTSTGNVISFAPKIEYSTALRPREIVLSDINGDSKPDIITANDEITSSNTLSILINSSTVGNLSFANYINFHNGTRPHKIFACDFDGDNKPDIISPNTSGSLLYASVLKNRVAEPIITSFTPASAAPGSTITITGSNFISVSSLTIGGQAVSSYTVVSSTSITAIVPNNSSGNTITVTTAFGTATLGGFSCSVCPKIYSIGPLNAANGAEVGISGVNFNGATQVLFGGVPATSFTIVSSTNIVAIVGNGNSGIVSVVTPYGTAQYSGFIFIPPPIITSFAPTSSCSGGIITITGSNFDSASAPKFGGTSVISYTVVSSATITATLGNGSSGNVTVVTPGGTASLGGFIFNVVPAITSQPVNQFRCSGTTTSFTVGATGSSLNYQWKKGTVNLVGATSSTLTLNNIALSDAGNYSCVISNSCGSVTSNSASLTVNQSATHTTTITTCNNSYLWAVNGQTYTSNGTYTSVSDCHTEVLNLILTTIPNVNYSNASNGAYQVGIPITPLTNTNTGGIIQNSDVVTTLNSGLYYATGLEIDTSNNVFFGDISQYTLNRLDTNSVLTDLNYTIGAPLDIAIDTIGNLFIADFYNTSIVKIAPNQTVSFIGSGFHMPYGVAVDQYGNVYVADTGNNAIKKIATNGAITILANIGILQPRGIAVDLIGNVYFSDSNNNAIKKIDINGTISTLGFGFINPGGVDVDSLGNVYVADTSHSAIKRIAIDGTISVLGLGFYAPFGVTVDDFGDNVYVADYGNGAIKKISIGAGFKYSISPALPAGLNIDNATGTISGTPTEVTPNTTYTISVQNSCGTSSTTITFSTFSLSEVYFKLFIEGYYDTTTNAMRPVKNNIDGVSPINNVEDLIVELRHPQSYAVIATSIGTLHTDGTLLANFTSITNDSYYIVVKGRNIIQTWSATPIAISSITPVYDFTDASSKAYGNNMTEVQPGVWALYSGDINQDFLVDSADYSVWEEDNNNFFFGNYATDLNGDGYVDSSDYSIWGKNANDFIYSMHP